MEEKELISRIKAGDKVAFKELYQKYWSKVHNFSRLFLTSSSEIEEVVQEVFVKLWEVRYLLRPDDRFEGFLLLSRVTLYSTNFDVVSTKRTTSSLSSIVSINLMA